MSLESLETSNDIQFSQNESFNRSSSSSPAVSDHLNYNNNNNSGDTQRATSHSKMHKCKQCDFICVNKEDYWLHQRHMHIKPEKLLECTKCQFVTEYKHHLEYHLRNHMGSKPYKCTQCEYACVNLSMLRSHSKSHSKAIQYNCAECSYSTKYYNSLKAHMDKLGHTCLKNTNPVNPISVTKGKKLKNKKIDDDRKIETSFSSSSSTCSSSSFDDVYVKNRPLIKPVKSTIKKKLNNFKVSSVNSSSSSVSSNSDSLSSSPNNISQLNINPYMTFKNKSSDPISPQLNLNTTAALAAAAMAYRQQQQSNILLNPVLLSNPLNLRNSINQSNETDQISSVLNTLNQINSNKAILSNFDVTNNQFNFLQQQLQLQMALSMITNNTNNQQFPNLFSDVYAKQQLQQKTQQEQLLQAYIQQSQAYQIPNLHENILNLNNKRVIVENINDTPKRVNTQLLNNIKNDSSKSRLSYKKDLKKNLNKLSSDKFPNNESSDRKANSKSDLYECFQCELIFRNYEMFCNHKILHEIKDKKSENDGRLKKQGNIIQENSEFFNCKPGKNISDAMQIYMQMQTSLPSDSFEIQLIDPVEEEH